MKKSLSALCIVLVIATTFVSNVLAAPAQASKNVSLSSVTYERSGITLLFNVSGLSKNDLKNISFTAHSRQWNMTCNFGDDASVRCLVSKKLSIFAGESFQGTLAGFHFAGKLPSAREFPIRVTPTMTLLGSADPAACPDGQTLSYTFEYSNSAYQAEVWSDYYMDPETFHSLYNVASDYMSTYVDIDTLQTYYIYSYTTYTSGYGTTPSDNWDALVSAYESDGYTIQNTGAACN